MEQIRNRLGYLFASTKGLILVAIAMIALETAIWGMLSGPMAEFGVRDWVIKTLGMKIVQAEREGRIIILYHSIAMAVVAIEVYMINGLLPLKPILKTITNSMITVGYMMAMIFGMGFAYFGRNWAFHGLYIAGLSLIFFAGVVFTISLWPWKREACVKDRAYAHAGGVNLELTAFFTTAAATLISVLFGAVPGSFFGNGFETFLAENIIRNPEKTPMEYAVIGHLHIMLALICVMMALIIGRWLDFKGVLHKIAMPLMILGAVVLSLGVWGVVTPLEPVAHMVIYVGATPSMLAALMLVIFGWDKLIRQGTAGVKKPGLFKKLAALLDDPLRFGPLWQMVFMNLTTSGVGIFMAVQLDEIFRVWPAREERIELTGHWHVLSAIVATIILLYYGDMIGLKGRLRKLFGWSVIILSDMAFAAVTVFEMKRLVVSEAAQQPLVNVLMLVMDFGLAMLLVVLAIVMGWRLLDLFRARGRWTEEAAQNDLSAEVK
jgi:hypothetical protein